MQKKNSFVTTHLIPLQTNGTLYYFPKTLRDVYAFRVRHIANNGGTSGFGAAVTITSPDLLSGYRAGTNLNGEMCYSIATFCPRVAVPTVYKQPKHYCMIDMELHHVQFNFINEVGSHIIFNPAVQPYFVIDFWHRNKHQD